MHARSENNAEEQELFEHRKFTVDKGQTPVRIDKFLFSSRLFGSNTTRTQIQYAAEAGNIHVNGKAVKPGYKIKPGDEILLMLASAPRKINILSENIPLDIIYEDKDIVVLNKKAGMVVHPAHGNYSGTLVNALLHHCLLQPSLLKGREAGADFRPGLVHRLDKDTSGLMVVAKNELALVRLAEEMLNRKISRKYAVLVWGKPKEKEGTVNANIGRNPGDRKKMTAFTDDSRGKPAVTHYCVLESFGYVSLLECTLETGRTHQIRVHMKHIGHPVFGDKEYGGNKILRGTSSQKYRQFVQHCFSVCPRQALHAKALTFQHPSTGKKMQFHAALPQDMRQVIEEWKQYLLRKN